MSNWANIIACQSSYTMPQYNAGALLFVLLYECGIKDRQVEARGSWWWWWNLRIPWILQSLLLCVFVRVYYHLQLPNATFFYVCNAFVPIFRVFEHFILNLYGNPFHSFQISRSTHTHARTHARVQFTRHIHRESLGSRMTVHCTPKLFLSDRTNTRVGKKRKLLAANRQWWWCMCAELLLMRLVNL